MRVTEVGAEKFSAEPTSENQYFIDHTLEYCIL